LPPLPPAGEGWGEGVSTAKNPIFTTFLIPTIIICMKTKARKLRKHCTDTEAHLWYHLRNRHFSGQKFKRQYIIGPYIVDFICLEKMLIIELDGGQHASLLEYDEERNSYLKKKEYTVLRFWNDSVFLETDAVLQAILDALE
jgi:very-short-patch-repair endonuclease